MTNNSHAIIIGAGPAGLSCAVTMRAAGLDVTVLEKSDSVGAVWRGHYDRLHLHTDRGHSGLPLPGVDVLDAQGMPRVTGKPSGAPGLYFCGQITVPTSQLREIAIEAERIAASARAYLRKSAHST